MFFSYLLSNRKHQSKLKLNTLKYLASYSKHNLVNLISWTFYNHFLFSLLSSISTAWRHSIRILLVGRSAERSTHVGGPPSRGNCRGIYELAIQPARQRIMCWLCSLSICCCSIVVPFQGPGTDLEHGPALDSWTYDTYCSWEITLSYCIRLTQIFSQFSFIISYLKLSY